MKRILLTICQLLFATLAMAQNITFGVISDIHQDLQRDAKERLQKFLDKSAKRKPNFIISLGDLSHSTGADSILRVWNSYPGTKYNIFGNHDMDNSDKATMLAKYQMPASYYSVDHNGVHFVMLDCCFTRKNNKVVDYNRGNYFVKAEDRDLISDEQLVWLANDLANTTLPTVLFSHQAFDEIGGSVPNRAKFRSVIAKHPGKIAAVICGHHHIDAHSVIEGVNYLQINSASYLWVDGKQRYSNGNMAEYRDPLYAFVTINTHNRTLTIKGVKSEFVSPAPQVENFSLDEWQYITPSIRNRKIKF